MRHPTFNLRALAALFATVTLLTAAPYPPEGLPTAWKQSSGEKIQLRVFGDEFYGRTETQDGYTVVFNGPDQNYYFAQLSQDGQQLVPSKILVSGKAKPPFGKHLKIPSQLIAAQRAETQMQLFPEEAANWSRLVKAARHRELAKKNKATQKNSEEDGPQPEGEDQTVLGLTIMAQFPDDPETIGNDPVNFPIPHEKVERYCNSTNYRDDGSTGSVREYFFDQSLGAMTYTQLVPEVVTLPHPRSWYNYSDYPTNTELNSSGTAGRLLVQHAVEVLVARGFDFTPLTIDSGRDVIATNLLYAGETSGVWNKGLWPHRWSLSPDINVGTTANPIYIDDYQITDAPHSALEIGTFIHENGHLLLGYPDLYDKDGGSNGIGTHCLMSHGGSNNSGRTPAPINGYLKDISGWSNVIDISTLENLLVPLSTVGNQGYRIRKPGSPNEYFFIENRGDGDRWAASVPDTGILIWHIDESASGNDDDQMTESEHFEVSLEQADGLFDLENDRDFGDDDDCFDLSTQAFSRFSTPNTSWWDGSISGITVQARSTARASMNVRFGSLPTNTVSVASPNGGESYVPGGTATITWGANITGNVKIELYQGDSLHSILSEDEEGNGSFVWMISPDLALGDDYKIRISSLQNDNYSDLSDLPFTIGEEIFPALGQIPENWVTSPEADLGWEISSTDFTEGGVSLKSGPIGSSQAASVQYAAAFSAGEVSFKVRVSSEQTHDQFQFLIDGVEQISLTGEVGWEQETFQVSAGHHVLEWRYQKDSSVDTGEDAAWIDEVVLPPLLGPDIILVSAPADGESLAIGASFPITWTASVAGELRIELYQGLELVSVISESEPNDRNHLWLIDPELPPRSDYRIRISSLANPAVEGFSENNFTLVDEVFPDGGAIPQGWTSGAESDADWTISTTEAAEGGLSIRSGLIGHSEISSTQVTDVFSAGTVNFSAKVSSESNYDFLRFYVNGIERLSLSGEESWQDWSFEVPAGNHTFMWEYSKDGSGVSGGDGAWIDDVSFPPGLPENQIIVGDPRDGHKIVRGFPTEITWAASISGNVRIALFKGDDLEELLGDDEENDGTFEWFVGEDIALGDDYQIRIRSIDQPALEGIQDGKFTIALESFPKNKSILYGWMKPSDSTAEWVIESGITSEGAYALRSAPIGDSQSAVIRHTDHFEAGTIRFMAKVSSEQNYDFFSFYVDGVQEVSSSGEIDWREYVIDLPSGRHTLEWGFQKDSSASVGLDSAWIDDVSLPATIPITSIEDWRFAHFGTRSDSGIAADTADPDGDGVSNLQEFTSGTYPNDHRDFLHFLSMENQSDQFVTTFPGKVGRAYELQRSSGMNPSDWQTVQQIGPLTEEGPKPLVDTLPPPGKAFYRLWVSEFNPIGAE